MDPLTACRRAEGAFVSVLAKVGPGQADAPTPCTEWSVRDVVAHVVAGNWWLAGGQPRQVPDDIEGLIGAYAASAEAAYSVLAAPQGLGFPSGRCLVPWQPGCAPGTRWFMAGTWRRQPASPPTSTRPWPRICWSFPGSRSPRSSVVRGAVSPPSSPAIRVARRPTSWRRSWGGPSDDGPPAPRPTGRTAAGHGPAPQTLPNPRSTSVRAHNDLLVHLGRPR
jgi:Mycothiol maleylpyruvate isomerase N-terminal domain